MKRRSVAGLALALVLGTAGCGSGDGGSRFVSVGTAPPGGAFFVVGGALAEVLDEYGGEGLSVTAEATKGSQENIRRLVRGELDLALANSAISYHAVRGAGGWGEASPIRAVMTLAPNVALFVTPEGSGIREIGDLAGRRVVVGPAGAGFEYFIRPILDAHGVTYDDFTPLHGTQAQAVDMLADGSAAAAFLGGAVPTASITQISTSQDVRFVPFAADARASLIETFKFFRPATIKAGTYRGQTDAFEGLDVGSMHLIAAADADEELVYRLTRTIWENREAVVARHPAGRAIREENVARDTGIEFHPGALRFYREIGVVP